MRGNDLIDLTMENIVEGDDPNLPIDLEIEEKARLERLRAKKRERKAAQVASRNTYESGRNNSAARHYPTPGPPSPQSRSRPVRAQPPASSSPKSPMKRRRTEDATAKAGRSSKKSRVVSRNVSAPNSPITSRRSKPTLERTYSNTEETAILISSDEDEDDDGHVPAPKRARVEPEEEPEDQFNWDDLEMKPVISPRPAPTSLLGRLSLSQLDAESDSDSGSESDWDNYHAGFVNSPVEDDPISSSDLSSRTQGVSLELSRKMEKLAIEFTPYNQAQRFTQKGFQHADRLLPSIIPPPPPGSKLERTVPVNPKLIPWPGFRPEIRPSWHSAQTRRVLPKGRGSGFDGDFGEGAFELVSSFRQASGAVNFVSQSGPLVTVASAALGGAPGTASLRDIETCNKPGGVLAWDQAKPSRISTLSGHFKKNQHLAYLDGNGTRHTRNATVYYTVNDIKFHPCRPKMFISSSQDDTVRSWELGVNGNFKASHIGISYTYPPRTRPFHLDFKPDSPLLAVGCENGSTYLHFPGIPEPQQLRLQSDGLSVSSQVWGPHNDSGANPDLLFIGGQSVEECGTRGNVRTWKLRPERAQLLCDITGTTADYSCESLCIDAAGTRLAMFCAGYDDDCSRHTVQIYDIRCNPAKSILGRSLAPFQETRRKRPVEPPRTPTSSTRRSSRLISTPTQPQYSFKRSTSRGRTTPPGTPGKFRYSGEVTLSSFSPDGIYLACGRDDNAAHVWDSRFMGRHPAYILEHGQSKAELVYGDNNNGVTAMSWICHAGPSSPPLLVTGGDDGAIRLWDMRKHQCQGGEMLAELETNVGHFTIGDVRQGEMPLVAGDCHAKLYIYNYKGRGTSNS